MLYVNLSSAGLWRIEQNFCTHSILFEGCDVTVQLAHLTPEGISREHAHSFRLGYNIAATKESNERED